MIACYARYSSDHQRESSIDDQVRNCEQWAARQDLRITHHYADRAMSGARHDRPDYQRMLADAQSGAFQVLIVDDLSRLSRDDIEMKRTLRRLRFLGVRVVGASDGYDSQAKGHKVQAFARGFVNELYLDDLADKTHRGLTGKALAGLNAGGRSYGYRAEPITDPARTDEYGRPMINAVRKVIDPEQAAIVRQIYQWFADGRSPAWIAAELNRQGIPGPRGKWSRTTIYGDKRPGVGILSNPLYIGQYAWNRSRWIKDPDTGKRVRRERPRHEWIVQDLPELRIVDDVLWQRVQRRIAAKRRESTARALAGKNTGGRYPRYLFSGLLVCGECGGNYVMVNRERYGCGAHKDKGPAVCANAMQVRRDTAEARLLERIKAGLLTPEALELFRRETSRLLRERKKAAPSDTAKKQLEKVEREITNLVDAIRQSPASPALLAALQDAEQRRAGLQAQIRVQTRPRTEMPDILANAEHVLRQMVEALETSLSRDIPAARSVLVQLLGETIPVWPDKEKGHLVAEVGLDTEGLLAASGGHKISLVAGAGFGRYLVDLK